MTDLYKHTNFDFVKIWRYWYTFALVAGTGIGIIYWGDLLDCPVVIYYLAGIALLLPASFFDMRDGLIPNKLVLAGFGSALVLLIGGMVNWSACVPAALGVFLLLQGIRWASSVCFSHSGLGMGDVKLLFVSALFVGWEIYWIIYLAILFGGLFATVGLLLGWLDRKTQLPFAPFITLATATVVFWLPWQQVAGWL